MGEDMTDSEMIDWLEEFVNKNGSILLYDGKSNVGGLVGFGLRPGFSNRTLREAITQSSSPDRYAGEDGEKCGK